MAGNRLTVEEGGATSGPGFLASYAYDSLNRRVGAALDGGLVATGYGYDDFNRLITTPGSSMAYDALGRLNASYNNATGVTTQYLYSGSDLIGEYDAAGHVLARYVPGPGVDNPIVSYTGSGAATRTWLLADEHGSIIAQATQAGGVANINTYDEYGVPGPSNAGRFQYAGQAWIPEAGLYDDKARFYSPTLGRFLQTDPIGYGDGLNWYNYTHGDPVNNSDPTGMDSPCGPGETCNSLSGDDGGNGDDGGEGGGGDSGTYGSRPYYHGWNPGPTIYPAGTIYISGSNLGSLDKGGGGKSQGMQGTAKNSKACSALRAQANSLGAALNFASQELGLFSVGAAGGAVISALGEVETAGLDTPLTIGMASAAAQSGVASTITGGLGAALQSYGSGSSGPLASFAFNQANTSLASLMMGAASPIKGVADLASGLIGQAQNLIQASAAAGCP